VVINEPHVYEPGDWRAVVDRLVASGRFRLVAADGPLALLEVSGGAAAPPPTPRPPGEASQGRAASWR
jgi:hypothetical protein